ncbi:transmembrane protein [Ceratobasidium theobromae]|uniref:Transmembrane protein n=1 Tax=Ceratobasidium theobromae TaxID=1582974 RepID=A0A5N5QLV4_9AGAM|nr:transmembrane protein [Ceratobasidium theobromae]
MLAFSRLTSILFFVLSLGLLTYALPTESKALAARHTGQELVDLVVGLRAHVEADVGVLAHITAVADLSASVDVLVGHVTTCAKAIAALGANIEVEAAVKANIAAEVAAIVIAIVQVCVSIVAKFGVLVVLTLLAKIDICLQLLLVNLGVCVGGLIQLVAAIVVKLGVSVFASVHLGLCINVLGLIGLSL